ncbi:MAG: CBS domain-containing protein [Candidatus Thorarchaeota archaeon]
MESEFKSIGDIKVSEFMIIDPFYTTPDEKISVTELLMLKKNIGGLPVVKDSNEKQLIGIITQRDIRLARFAMNLDSPHTKVKDLMTPHPIILSKDDSLKLAMRKMLENKVDRLPVINSNHKLIGLVTKHSIMIRIFEYLKD